jgi:hypothetical protein
MLMTLSILPTRIDEAKTTRSLFVTPELSGDKPILRGHYGNFLVYNKLQGRQLLKNNS